ncbi:MAG: ribosome-associated protein [Porticoccus sp.]|jgi:ribosome-associated protein
MKDVYINREPTELYKILKFEGMTESGAAAKIAVATGLVKVNGAIETRKRKKIISGDIIMYNNEEMYVRLV